MNFIKKHYEKVLLGTVLVGLVVVAAILLPVKVATEKADLEQQRQEIVSQRLDPLPPLNASQTEAALKRVQNPAKLNFAAPHNLFNPVPWQKTPDGRLIKPPQTGGEIGAQVTKVAPLNLTITFDSVGASGSNYLIKIERETELSATRRKQSEYVTLDVKASKLPVTLRSVKGPPDKPSELILELSDTLERVSVAPDRPYRQVDGYTADLRCEAENKTWRGSRVGGAKLLFAGDEFTIIAINLVATNQFEVVLSARSTGKKSTITFEKKDDDSQKAATQPNAAP